MTENGQALTYKYIHTSLFTIKNNIRPTSCDLANMSKAIWLHYMTK